MVKAQFFIISGVILVITMSAIVGYLVLPTGLKMSSVEFQRISLNKAYNIKGFLDRLSETMDWKEVNRSYLTRVELKENSNISGSFVTGIDFDLRDGTNPDSSLVFSPRPTKHQVHWTNESAKIGTLYAELNYEGLENKTVDVYYDSLTSQDYTYKKRDETNNTFVKKDGDSLLVDTPVYHAVLDLNQGGVMTSFKTKFNNEEWAGSEGLFNVWNLQDSGTTTLSEYYSGPVFGYAKVYAYNFDDPDSVPVFSRTEYFFFEDYVMANITVKNSTSTSGLDDMSVYFNHACNHDWSYEDSDGGSISGFCSGSSSTSTSGVTESWGLLEQDSREAKIFLTNFSEWFFDSATPTSASVETSDSSDHTKLTASGASSDELGAVMYLKANYTLDGSDSQSLLLGNFEQYVHDEESVESRLDSLLNYLKVAGVNEGYGLETSYDTVDQKVEEQPVNNDWAEDSWNRTNITLVEDSGFHVNNTAYEFSFATTGSPDITVPTSTSNFVAMNQEHGLVPWSVDWETTSPPAGNITLLLNLTGGQNNSFMVYYNSDNSGAITYPTEDFTTTSTATNSSESLNQVYESFYDARTGFRINSSSVKNATSTVELSFTESMVPKCLRVFDEQQDRKLTQPSFYYTGSSSFTTHLNASLNPNFTLYNLNGTNFTVTVTNTTSNDVIYFNVTHPDGSLTNLENSVGNGSTYTVDAQEYSGQYGLSVSGNDWFHVSSSLPKLVLNSKTFEINGTSAEKLLFQVDETDSFVNTTMRLTSSGAQTTISLEDDEHDTLSSESISQDWEELNFTGEKRPNGRMFWLNPTQLAASAGLEVVLNQAWPVSESENNFFNPERPRLNLSFLNDFSTGSQEFFAYHSSHNCGDEQSTDLNQSGLNVSNSFFYWDFDNMELVTSGNNWFFDTSTYDFETRVTDLSGQTFSNDLTLTGAEVVRTGNLFSTVSTNLGDMNFSFTIYAHSPFIKVNAQLPVNSSRIIEFKPRVRLNNNRDYFWKVYGYPEGLLNSTEVKVPKNLFNCSNKWSYVGRRDNDNVFAIILPCDLLVSNNATASLKDSETEIFTEAKLYPRVRENVFYLYVEENNEWSQANDFVEFLNTYHETSSKAVVETSYFFDNLEFSETSYQ